MTTTSRLVAAKEDMSTDNQEDSSANKEALESSQKVAKKAENVSLGADTEHAEGCTLNFMQLMLIISEPMYAAASYWTPIHF